VLTKAELLAMSSFVSSHVQLCMCIRPMNVAAKCTGAHEHSADFYVLLLRN